MENPKFVFFGTPASSVIVLEKLKEDGLIPRLIVTAPDKPQGRKMIISPPPVAIWARENNVAELQPEKLTDEVIEKIRGKAPQGAWDFFVVVAYGYILPQSLLDIPKKGVLNVHPSLLPKYRGASPIRTAILEGEEKTGVSVMVIDEEVDHGPTLSSETIEIDSSIGAISLERRLFEIGGKLLANTIPKWLSGSIEPKEQKHEEASFSNKIKRENGLIDLEDDAYKNLRKIRAYEGWPGTYFFTESGTRVKIIDAEIEHDKLKINRVIPEGKNEMRYEDFFKN
ncbi:MAG: methionyl-tRNA formyltransferase [Candidatus Pacebacteria bacterium]|jgi:methionyl-tRNA formyltransferase|nr:methionyl-tRNA formyltransferase [bacterium]MDP6527430.1 methionyl-tRNA formyltransferase [Candidatus Paceibacterota bacterium]MDP6659663.1 methionyl-tRNA formyltransferase [Candidatus Paceibacterota bacterium]|tara:strand:- start:3269 stop:4117 length:849 start_codon:yes stop_codon:yes gene_type:complete